VKILVITNLYPPQLIGGYERSIADHARLLYQRGHAVHVLTSSTEAYTTSYTELTAEPAVKRTLNLCGEWTQQTPINYSPDRVQEILLCNRQVISAEIESFQPDVCLAGNIDFLELDALEIILASGVPILHYVMNGHPGYVAELAPKTLRYQYITCSEWIQRTLEREGYPTATAQTIYPGAAVEEFYQKELPPRDYLRIAYASLVMPYKGADILMEALSLLKTMELKFTATFAGGSLTPEFVDALQTFAKAEGMQDQIAFAGALSRQGLKQLYRKHNVLVFPSRFPEPFGISQIEAMASGLALVTSGTGGACETIRHGKEGFLFESENFLDLADTLYYLATHTDEWKAIAHNGQQHAMSKFSQTKAVEEIESVLLNLINRI
jgi:glycogen synthase